MLVNPYKIENKIEIDTFSGIEYPYFYVYDNNRNFVERFFYGDNTKPGFGENGWTYIDMPFNKVNAYNFSQLKNTIENFDRGALPRFLEVEKAMQETGLPYHLALSIIPKRKEDVEDEMQTIPFIPVEVERPEIFYPDDVVPSPIEQISIYNFEPEEIKQDSIALENNEVISQPLINVQPLAIDESLINVISDFSEVGSVSSPVGGVSSGLALDIDTIPKALNTQPESILSVESLENSNNKIQEILTDATGQNKKGFIDDGSILEKVFNEEVKETTTIPVKVEDKKDNKMIYIIVGIILFFVLFK